MPGPGVETRSVHDGFAGGEAQKGYPRDARVSLANDGHGLTLPSTRAPIAS